MFNRISSLFSGSISKEQFIKAVIDGNLKEVQAYLDQNKSNPQAVNVAMPSGVTALILAVRSGHVPVVQALLAVPDININAVYRFGGTALDSAVVSGNIAVVKLLLAVPDIRLDVRNEHGRTAAEEAHRMMAVSEVHKQIYILITTAINEKALSASAAQSTTATTATAAAAATVDSARAIASTAAAPAVAARISREAFLKAARENDLGKLRQYIEENSHKLADAVNVVDENGDTALILAAAGGHADVVLALLGADNSATESRNIALLRAATCGHAAVIPALLANGANVNTVDRFDGTPLIHAAAGDHAAVIRELLAAGANVNAVNRFGNTALFCAAVYGRTTAVITLLAFPGINLEPRNYETGRTAAEEVKSKMTTPHADFRACHEIYNLITTAERKKALSAGVTPATTATAAAAAVAFPLATTGIFATPSADSHVSACSPSSYALSKTDASSSGKPAVADQDLQGYPEYVKRYIKSFERNKTMKQIIEELELTGQEEERFGFEIFQDAIHESYMEIPVIMHEKNYDLKTLANINIDPFTNESFERSEVSTARRLFDDLEIRIKQLKQDREARYDFTKK